MRINKILTRPMYTSAVVGMSVFIITLTIMVAASASTSHYKPTATEEFSGEVVQLTGVQTNNIIWNASNFGGFCYNLNDEECIGTETLTILADTLEGPDTDRIIDDTWTCTIPPTWHEYEVYSNTGLTVNNESGYWMDIFGCEKYIAISRNPNKYTKPLIEFNSTDTKTLGVGESWDLGVGLTLTALEIDVDGKEVWFSLCENGIEIDSKVDMEGQVYTYTKEIAGEEDIPFFSYYVDAISHGTNTNIVQIKYAFRIEDEIVDYSLEYATTPIWHEYELYKNLGLTVERNYYASDSGYWTEFWMAERYIAINGNASKLARPLVEFNSTDTKTLRVGEMWDLGGGFTFSAQEIDIEGDEVWFTLSKNGDEIGSTVVGTGDSDLQTRICTLTEDVAGESDIPIFSCYVCGVFAGTDSNIVQVKYVFLMDNDILQITTGEYYDNMEVVSATSSSVTLGNRKDLYLNQSQSTCQIMGNLSFKTIYNTSAIEFYPYLIKDELPVLSGGGGFTSDCCGNNSWDLFENYTIGLIQVDLIGKKAWVVLCKDGVVVDERILTEEYKAQVDSDCRYSYVKNGIEIINATLKEAFLGCNTDMVELGEVYQRSEVDGSILINNEFHVFPPATEPGGISWNLSDDYMFTADIGCYDEEVRLQLSKNGMVVKEKILNEDNTSTFTYTSGIGGINCVVDCIFHGNEANVVKIVNVNQYSDVNGTALIADGAHFFKSADPDGMPLELTDGYALTIKDINNHNNNRCWHHVDNKVWLELSKDGNVLEENILKTNDLFTYTNNLESFSCVMEAVFNGCLADVVKLKNINQYSSTGVQLIDNESKMYATADPIGEIWELWEGYSFAPKDIDLCESKVWLSLLKDGVLVKDAIISEDEWFRYYNSTGALVFGTYVETVFAGMNTNLVKVGYTTQYSEIDGRLFIEPDTESWQLQEGYYLTAQEIYNNNSVWLQLSKNNKLVDEGLFNDSFDLQNGTAGHMIVSGTIKDHDNRNVQLVSITQYHEANGTSLTTWSSMNLKESLSYDNTKLMEAPTCDVPSFTTVSIENVSLAPGESTTVPIMVNNVDNLGGCRINLTYNASVVHVSGVLKGDMEYLTYNIDNGTGWMTANALNDSGLNGDIVFANIELNAVGIKGEETLLDITVIQLIDTGLDPIDHSVIDGTFIIETDTEAPAVTDASSSPDTILNDNGRPRAPGSNTTILSVKVTDADSGVANVTIDLSSIGGYANDPMVREGETDTWTVSVNAVAGINLTHHLTVNATDNKGNFNDSVCITLTVLRRGDVCRNNVIDNNDVIYIARYLADLEPECSNPPGLLVGDVVGLSGDTRGDSIVDLMDALYLARYIAGLEGEP